MVKGSVQPGRALGSKILPAGRASPLPKTRAGCRQLPALLCLPRGASLAGFAVVGAHKRSSREEPRLCSALQTWIRALWWGGREKQTSTPQPDGICYAKLVCVC